MSIASAVIAVLLAVTLTLIVLPDWLRPSPAVNEPAPENCVHTIAVAPIVIVPFVETTNPLSALVEPSSTKAKVPGFSSPVSTVPLASDEREAAPSPEATAT
jgi:hypothetical protein